MITTCMHAVSWTCGLALALGFIAPAHAAATANFQGPCTWNAAHTHYTCNFDANRPASNPSRCPGSFIWKYQWDFDHGSSLLTGNPVVTHLYADGPERVPTQNVLCWSGEVANRSHHVCNRIGTPGCIKIDGIWR